MDEPRTDSRVLALSFSGFILLGISTAILGVAWPSIRESYQLQLDDVGVLLIVTTIGYTFASLVSGQAAARFGTGRLLVFANLCVVTGLIIQALSPDWWLMVAVGFLVGLGNGNVDAGTNIYLAPRVRSGVMNWLHATFGVGSTFGPILVAGILQLGYSWRWAYGIAGILQACLLVTLLMNYKKWHASPSVAFPVAEKSQRTAPAAQSLKVGRVWLYVLIFFFYGGVEGSTGQWSYTLFTQSRNAAPLVAGAWMSIYWATFTLGRFLIGFLKTNPARIVWAGSILMIFGAILYWWNPVNLVGFLGLAFLGLALAPLFPSLTSNTPRFVGEAHAPNAIGFQVASSSISIGMLPPLAGLIAARFGLESIGPFVLVLAGLVFILYERSRKMPKLNSTI